MKVKLNVAKPATTMRRPLPLALAAAIAIWLSPALGIADDRGDSVKRNRIR